MSETIYTYLLPMPANIKGYTVLMDDVYTIVINSNLDEFARFRAYLHEMQHIRNDDLQKNDSADHTEHYNAILRKEIIP